MTSRKGADNGTDPWLVWDGDYPAEGDQKSQLRFILNYAVLAHSPYNSQPWRFDITQDEIVVMGDRTRRLPSFDPRGRSLTMSCGAALYHLKLALRHFGFKFKVALLPDPEDSYIFARLRVSRPAVPAPEERLLFLSIPFSRLIPDHFETRDLPETLRGRLEEAATAQGAWLRVVPQGEPQRAVAECVREGGSQQWADAGFRKEFSSWLRSNRSKAQDGIPGYALNLGDAASYMAPLMLRHSQGSLYDKKHNFRLALHAPMVVVLGTAEENPAAWLAAGQALAQLLLMARSMNVFAWIFYEPMEIPELRQRLLDTVNADGYPQALVRLGYGKPFKPPPRRGVDQVLAKDKK